MSCQEGLRYDFFNLVLGHTQRTSEATPDSELIPGRFRGSYGRQGSILDWLCGRQMNALPIVLLFWLCFGATAGGIQGLLLALHSEMTPGRLWGPYWMPGIDPGTAMCKANALPTVLSIALASQF